MSNYILYFTCIALHDLHNIIILMTTSILQMKKMENRDFKQSTWDTNRCLWPHISYTNHIALSPVRDWKLLNSDSTNMD